ncbi:hypothetical protein SAMN05443428_10290 [Caloramator quimbayensis]|uniref:Uncharacterized protein n=1 Tax=Caloramator quimbayensis TaxID=1147123 RepID=A0A1T4WMA1_9CLOT|nr:hypothetical protein [Caloramator quimbayensis]SKA77998.1 hypothetical protein SAMN05443428_10290 [Caloramator quimbayensis]
MKINNSIINEIGMIVKEAFYKLSNIDQDLVLRVRDCEPSISYETLKSALKEAAYKVKSEDEAEYLKSIENKLNCIVDRAIKIADDDEKLMAIGKINDVVAYNIMPSLLKKAKDTVNDVPYIVKNTLAENECIIYKISSAEFEIPNKSIVGDHIIFISSKGRVFAYDSGGIFGQASCYNTSYPIKVIYGDNVNFSSSKKELISYNCNIKIEDFFKLLRKIDKKCFDFIEYPYDSLINADCYSYGVELEIDSEKFIIKDFEVSKDFYIYYKYIESFNFKNSVLDIKGHFCFKYDDDESIFEDISLIISKEEDLDYLYKYFSERSSIYSVVPEGSEILYGSLTGYINDVFYSKRDMAFAKTNNLISFVDIDSLKIIFYVDIDVIKYYCEDNNLFIFFDENPILIEFNEKEIEMLELNSDSNIEDDKLSFGYTNEEHPVVYDITHDGIIFKKSSKDIIKIENNEIKDIYVKEIFNNSNFTDICIQLKDDREYSFYLLNKSVSQLIRETYKNSKLKMCDDLNVKQLFTSWTRQVNDVLNFYYFGSLFCLKEDIDKLFKNKNYLSDEELTSAANMLYYGVQEQKRQLEVIGVYFPKMLERDEAMLMKKYGANIDSIPFKTLQKQLLSIASQIQKSLSDVERALSQIPFAIHPDINSRRVTTNSRYRQAGTMGAVGVAGFALTGMLSIPFIAGSAINLWNTYKMDKELEDIEEKKVQIYAYQAIDTFNHVMNFMIPYYIDEVNQSLFYLFKQIAKYYAHYNDSYEVKVELIERISDLYTFKQLPISTESLKPKKELIENIHSSINIDVSEINNRLIKGGVENV